jgi:Xaa-Pro aminopeptidase
MKGGFMNTNEALFEADFPKEEYAARYARARQLMDEKGLDALLLSLGIHLRYLTGYRTPFWGDSPGTPLALIPRDASKAPTLILSRYSEYTRDTTWIEDVRFTQPDQPSPFNNLLELAIDAIHSKGLARGAIGMDIGNAVRDNMPQVAFETIKGGLPEVRILDSASVMNPLRVIKSPAEIEALRNACNTSAAAWKAGLEALSEGMSEKELAAVICRTILQAGEEAGLYRPWIIYMAAGQDMAVWCNVLPGNYRVQKGDLVLVDGGCTRKGYHCDFIRWGVIGEPSVENRYLLETAIQANAACRAKIRAGVTCGEVQAAGAEVFNASSIDHEEWMALGQVGHGAGLDVHEDPFITAGNETLLEPGMVITVEPVIVKTSAGRFAKDPAKRYQGRAPDMMVVEDMVLVTESGYELLTPLQPYFWIV